MSDVKAIISELQAAIASRDASQIRAYITQAKGAVAQAHADDKEHKGGGEAEYLSAILLQAEAVVAQETHSATGGSLGGMFDGANPPTNEFDKNVAKKFSDSEKNYYEGFNPNSDYYIQARDGDGKLKFNSDGTPALEKVKGEEIRHSIADVKYNALTEEEKKQIPEAERPKGSEMDQMKDLRHSINTLESRQALDLQVNGKGDEVAQMSQSFNLARDKIGNLEDVLKRVEDNKEALLDGKLTAPERKAKEAAQTVLLGNLEHARADLRGSLQTDVLDEALRLKKDEKRTPESEIERFTAVQVDRPASMAFTPYNKPDQSQSFSLPTLH